jgi:DNA-directed RNA polymerase subunit L
MEIELVEKSKDSISIRMKDADMTLISPLVRELLLDDKIEEVKFTAGSTGTLPVLYVKVKSGKPQAAIKSASKKISNEFKEARESLEKALK